MQNCIKAVIKFTVALALLAILRQDGHGNGDQMAIHRCRIFKLTGNWG